MSLERVDPGTLAPDQSGAVHAYIRDTTTINQWQRIRAKGSYGKGFKASMQNCLNKV